MRLAFWRAGKDKAVVQRALAKACARLPPSRVARSAVRRPRSARARPGLDAQAGLDHRPDGAGARGVARRRQSGHAALQIRSPHPDRRTRERVPAAERRAQRGAQRARSRRPSPARCSCCCRAILRARSSRRTSSPSGRNSIRCCRASRRSKSLLALFGIGRDPFSMTPEERVLEAYYERFTAYAVDKSRVIVIEFQSRDPELAARVANSIAEGYLVLQQDARQEQAKAAGQWLSGEIDESAQEGRRKPNPGSRISAPSRACSSAPTTPRCRTSRWARSTRN